MARPILYVSFDGVLQPLGYSQVVRVLVGLGRAGHEYHLLSLERPRDLDDASRQRHVRATLADAGVRWTPLAADLGGSVLRSAQALAKMSTMALKLAHAEKTQLIHARGYQSAVVADSVRRLTRVPYLFDARGCWIDERADWFAGAPAYAAGKFAERQLYANADVVVTLTELHAADVVDGAFGHKDPSRVVVIPTCADYDDFTLSTTRPHKPAVSDVVPMTVQERLRESTVIAMVGAYNRSYSLDAAARFLQYACRASSSTHVLVITHQQTEYANMLTRAGLSPSRFTTAAATHATMPRWLDWTDWGLLLVPDVVAQRGKMPTKLAEFFASGVRPIAYGCHSEMIRWVRRAGTGLVLDDLSNEALASAAARLIEEHDVGALRAGRERTAEHFSLQSGILRYAALLARH